ncbi:hypothetical protein Hdeb2414_s0069g00770811 [Helianthus debilis subsp. tardiflorus]
MYPLTCRSQAVNCFWHFKPLVENLFSYTIKHLQYDGAPELIRGSMAHFLSILALLIAFHVPILPNKTGLLRGKTAISSFIVSCSVTKEIPV